MVVDDADVRLRVDVRGHEAGSFDEGLEFSRVLLVGILEGTMPFVPKDADEGDEVARVDNEERERRLLFVAATRARDELVVTGYGRKSAFLERRPR